MKIQLSTSVHKSLRQFENISASMDLSNTKPVANSLESIREEFQRKKEDDARRLFSLLRDTHPELKPAEILELANKFGSM